MRQSFHTLFLVLFLICTPVVTQAAETLTIRSDVWPPYNGEPKSGKPGYMVQTLELIFKPIGYSVDYDVLSWTDSLEAVRVGKFGAVIGASKDDADDFIYPEESFGLSDTAFFIRKGEAWQYAGTKSLQKVRLGVIESYSYNEELDAYIKRHLKTDRLAVAKGDDPLADLIQMLQAGQIDAIAEDTNVMLSTMIENNVPVGSIVLAGRSEEVSRLYIAFSPARPESKKLAAHFDAGIRKLRANGALKGVLQLYGLKDWKTE